MRIMAKKKKKKSKVSVNTIPQKKQNIFAITIITVITCLLYYHITDNQLVFDSASNINKLRLNIWSEISTTFNPLSKRWFSYMTLGWIHFLFGENHLPYQYAFNIILHTLNGIILYFFAKKIFSFFEFRQAPFKKFFNSRTSYALIASLCFTASPVAVYGTAYLIQRSSLMANFFNLCSLFSFTLFLENFSKLNALQKLSDHFKEKSLIIPWIASIVFYFIAIHSKEHAVMLPGLFVLLVFLLRTPLNIPFKKLVFILFITIAACIPLAIQITFVNQTVLGRLYEPHAQKIHTQLEQAVNMDHSYLLSIITQSYMFFRYLFLWFVPKTAWMSIDMHLPFAESIVYFPHIIFFILFCLIPIASLFIYKKQNSLYNLLIFSLLSPWILFFPEFSTIRVTENFVLYRSYIWAPYLFLVIPLLATKLSTLFKKQYLITAFFVFYILLLSFKAENRIQSFESPVSVWKDAVSKVQLSKDQNFKKYRPFNNLGHALTAAGKLQEAGKYFRESLFYYPNYVKGHSNFAAILTTQKLYKEAKQHFKTALKYDPKFVDALNGLGVVYAEQKLYEESIPWYKKAIEANPEFPDAYYNLGNSYLNLRRFEEAKTLYEKAISLKPKFANAYNNLGIIYMEKRDFKTAIENFKIAIKYKPSNPFDAHFNLGNSYFYSNHMKEASREYLNAIRYNPKEPKLHYNLGVAYQKQGKIVEAYKSFQNAYKLNPNDLNTKRILEKMHKYIKITH